jgi:hypothetical protein
MGFPVQSVYVDQFSSSTTTSTPNFANPVTKGNMLLAGVGNYSGSASVLSSVTDTLGNTYTLLGTQNFATGQVAYVYYTLASISGGTNAVTATWGSAIAFTEVVAVEYLQLGIAADQNCGNSNSVGGFNLVLPAVTLQPSDFVVIYVRAGSSAPNTPSGFVKETASSQGYLYDLNYFCGGSLAITLTWGTAQTFCAILGGFSQQPGNSVITPMWSGGHL